MLFRSNIAPGRTTRYELYGDAAARLGVKGGATLGIQADTSKAGDAIRADLVMHPAISGQDHVLTAGGVEGHAISLKPTGEGNAYLPQYGELIDHGALDTSASRHWASGLRNGVHGTGSMRRHRYVFKNNRTGRENSLRSPMLLRTTPTDLHERLELDEP